MFSFINYTVVDVARECAESMYAAAAYARCDCWCWRQWWRRRWS